MAVLRHSHTGRVMVLADRNLAGRSSIAGIGCEDHRCSGEHASVFWDGRGWYVRDLGSRNGTWVGTRQARPGEPLLIRRGEKVTFGGDGERWILVFGGPPEAAAVSPEGELRCGRHGALLLPDEHHPELAVVRQGDHWVVEDEGRVLASGDVVDAGGRWRVLLPPVHGDAHIPPTAEPQQHLPVEALALDFTVSLDEEHVRLVVHTPDRQIELQERQYHYTLLLLARARLQDQLVADLPAADQGWVSAARLARMLKVPRRKVNLDVHRARHQLGEEVGVDDPAPLIERRVRPGSLRIGVPRLRVHTAVD